MTVRVKVVKPSDVVWPFDRDRAELRLRRRFGESIQEVDPFPSYAHDVDVVVETVELVECAFPLPEPYAPDYFVLPFDTSARTNGWTDQSFEYVRERAEGELPRWAGAIVLAGKRIPPHPAVTRYLVAHEYGHVVHYFMAMVAGDNDAGDRHYREYAKLRGFRSAKHYGGGTWHRRVSEVFANDFRILVAGVEAEYWPHLGVPRPENVADLVEWWSDQVGAHRRWMVDRGLKAAA